LAILAKKPDALGLFYSVKKNQSFFFKLATQKKATSLFVGDCLLG